MKQTRSVAFALFNGTGWKKASTLKLFKLVGGGGMKAETTEKDQKAPKLQLIENNDKKNICLKFTLFTNGAVAASLL